MNPRGSRDRVLPDIDEIPRMRKMLGLTQTALARLASISQSTVVKVEKRQMNPSYDIVRRIMNALESEMRRQEKRALVDQVQSRKVQFIDAKISLEEAAAEMRRFKFSQLPVFHAGRSVGSISDKTITNLILAGKEPRELARIRVEDVMDPPFPQIDAKAPMELAAGLLRHSNAVLVTTRGDVTGIVTKSDLMKLL
jgi:predicted transcriptional regulator